MEKVLNNVERFMNKVSSSEENGNFTGLGVILALGAIVVALQLHSLL